MLNEVFSYGEFDFVGALLLSVRIEVLRDATCFSGQTQKCWHCAGVLQALTYTHGSAHCLHIQHVFHGFG